MEQNLNPSREELEELLEKAKRDLQEKLDRMTPEERELAMQKAQKLIDEDAAAMQKLIEDGNRVAAGIQPQQPQKNCPYCGGPISGGKFCTWCGSRL